MNLSPHFTLAELTVTSTGLPNDPSSVEIARLEQLCFDFLEPLRARFGPLKINSGYRSPAVNSAVGGSPTSAHCFGCAADVHPPDSTNVREMMLWMRDESGLPYDQIIDELRAGGNPWLHVGMIKPTATPPPRHQELLFRNGIYTPFK